LQKHSKNQVEHIVQNPDFCDFAGAFLWFSYTSTGEFKIKKIKKSGVAL